MDNDHGVWTDEIKHAWAQRQRCVLSQQQARHVGMKQSLPLPLTANWDVISAFDHALDGGAQLGLSKFAAATPLGALEAGVTRHVVPNAALHPTLQTLLQDRDARSVLKCLGGSTTWDIQVASQPMLLMVATDCGSTVWPALDALFYGPFQLCGERWMDPPHRMQNNVNCALEASCFDLHKE